MKISLNKNKKAIAPLLIIALIGILIAGAYYGVLNTGSLVGASGYIEAPYIPFLKCDLSGTTRDYTKTIDGSAGQWLEIPDNTNGYSVTLMSEKSKLFDSNRRFDYYICPQKSKTTNCVHKTTEWKAGNFDLSLGQQASGRYVWVEYQGVYFFSQRPRPGASYKITYQPYTLQRTDLLRGSGEILGSEGCNVPDSEWNNRLIASFKDKIPSDGVRKLQPNEIFNYFSGTITRMSEGNMDGNFYCIYSNGEAKLYPIKVLKTASNSYNVVDILTISGTQDCCSGDNLPDKTCVKGKWVSTVKAECSMINPCEGNDWRPDYGTDNKAIRYECVNSKCVVKTKTVECNKDADCKATNLRCNLNSFKCEIASVGVTDEGTEILATSETDCLKQGNKWVPKTTTKKGLLFGLIPFGGSTEVVEAHCEPGTNWLMWIIIIAVVGVILYFGWPFIVSILQGLRGLFKSIPILGRLIP
jgi:hypothetical protein